MQVASLAAMTSSPRGSRSSSLMISWARRRSCSICSAYSLKIFPAVVSAIGFQGVRKRAVEFLLELAHLGADGRLRTIAGLSSFGKAFEPDDLQKRM